MAYEAHFTFNEYDGKATTWYATGNPMHSAFYIKGKLEGPCISWDENGNTKSIVHFKNGQIVQKSLSSTTSIETPLVNH